MTARTTKKEIIVYAVSVTMKVELLAAVWASKSSSSMIAFIS